MTVYEFLKQAAQSHSAVVGGGKMDEIRCDLGTHSITSGTRAIVENGCVVLPLIALENGKTFTLDGLIDFDGNPYAEIMPRLNGCTPGISARSPTGMRS